MSKSTQSKSLNASKKQLKPMTGTQKKFRESGSPFKIILEIVVRNETSSSGLQSSFTFQPQMNRLQPAEVSANDFSYQFTKSGISILRMTVEQFTQDFPPDTGQFDTALLDPENEVRILVIAKQEVPSGNGSFSL